VEVILEQSAKGKITRSMSNKKVHNLVHRARRSLAQISTDTVRRAREQASQELAKALFQ
jgi:hypothetical protein